MSEQRCGHCQNFNDASCPLDCVFRHAFPANDPNSLQHYQSCAQRYSRSHMSNRLDTMTPKQRLTFAQSLRLETELWNADRLRGSIGAIELLERRIEFFEAATIRQEEHAGALRQIIIEQGKQLNILRDQIGIARASHENSRDALQNLRTSQTQTLNDLTKAIQAAVIAHNTAVQGREAQSNSCDRAIFAAAEAHNLHPDGSGAP